MKFSNNKRNTVLSWLLLVLAVYILFTGGDTVVGIGALILSTLEQADD